MSFFVVVFLKVLCITYLLFVFPFPFVQGCLDFLKYSRYRLAVFLFFVFLFFIGGIILCLNFF